MGWGAAGGHTDRYGSVEAVGVDETLFWREGRWRTKRRRISVVDVQDHQLLDIAPGRTATSTAGWFRAQPADWRAGVRRAVLDMSEIEIRALEQNASAVIAEASGFRQKR